MPFFSLAVGGAVFSHGPIDLDRHHNMAKTRLTNPHFEIFGKNFPKDLDEIFKANPEALKTHQSMVNSTVGTPMPRGPYPYLWQGCGWTRIFFTDTVAFPRYQHHGMRNVSLNVSFGDVHDDQYCVAIEIFQPQLDHHTKQLVVPKVATGHKTLTVKQAKEILRNEAANWQAYEKSAGLILQRFTQNLKSVHEGAAGMLQLSEGPRRSLRMSQRERGPPLKTQDNELNSTPGPNVSAEKIKDKVENKAKNPPKKKGPASKRAKKRKKDGKKAAGRRQKRLKSKQNKGPTMALRVLVDESETQELLTHQVTLSRMLAAETYLRNEKRFSDSDPADVVKVVMEWLDDSKLKALLKDAITMLSPKDKFSLCVKYRADAIKKVAAKRAQAMKNLQQCEEAGKKNSKVFLGHLDSSTSASELPRVSPKQVVTDVKNVVSPGPTPAVPRKTPEKAKAPPQVHIDLVSPGNSPVKGPAETDFMRADNTPSFVAKPEYIRSSRAKSGFAGVSYEANRGAHPWRVKFNGSTIGRVKSKMEACELYLEAYNHHFAGAEAPNAGAEAPNARKSAGPKAKVGVTHLGPKEISYL